MSISLKTVTRYERNTKRVNLGATCDGRDNRSFEDGPIHITTETQLMLPNDISFQKGNTLRLLPYANA